MEIKMAGTHVTVLVLYHVSFLHACCNRPRNKHQPIEVDGIQYHRTNQKLPPSGGGSINEAHSRGSQSGAVGGRTLQRGRYHERHSRNHNNVDSLSGTLSSGRSGPKSLGRTASSHTTSLLRPGQRFLPGHYVEQTATGDLYLRTRDPTSSDYSVSNVDAQCTSISTISCGQSSHGFLPRTSTPIQHQSAQTRQGTTDQTCHAIISSSVEASVDDDQQLQRCNTEMAYTLHNSRRDSFILANYHGEQNSPPSSDVNTDEVTPITHNGGTERYQSATTPQANPLDTYDQSHPSRSHSFTPGNHPADEDIPFDKTFLAELSTAIASRKTEDCSDDDEDTAVLYTNETSDLDHISSYKAPVQRQQSSRLRSIIERKRQQRHSEQQVERCNTVDMPVSTHLRQPTAETMRSSSPTSKLSTAV